MSNQLKNPSLQSDGLASPEVAEKLFSVEKKLTPAPSMNAEQAKFLANLAVQVAFYYKSLVHDQQVEPYIAGRLASDFQEILVRSAG